MYCSPDTIDIVAEGPEGKVAVQVDHRNTDEIEAALDASVLLAMARVLQARSHVGADGRPIVKVVYVASQEPPPALCEALAACGAELAVGGVGSMRALPPAGASVAVLADRAFAGLAARVSLRCGLTEPVAVLRALEAEILAERPVLDDDPERYWLCVLELMAVAGAFARGKYGCAWVHSEASPDLPFGLRLSASHDAYPVNRARRFLADGEASSMFALVATIDDLAAGATRGPLMPCLRSRVEAEELGQRFRRLLDLDDDSVPVIIYGHDGEHAMVWLTDDGDLDQRHAEAIANLGAVTVRVDELEAGGVTLCRVSDSFFATEKLLDVAFMQTLHARLGSERLIAGIPCRWALLVAAPAAAGVLSELVDAHHAEAGTTAITRTLFSVHRGMVEAVVAVDQPPAAPPRKSFLRTLFGR